MISCESIAFSFAWHPFNKVICISAIPSNAFLRRAAALKTLCIIMREGGTRMRNEKHAVNGREYVIAIETNGLGGRVRDFFSSHIRNPHTCRAYLEAVRQFSAFCAGLGIGDLGQMEPFHVAAFVEAQLKMHSRPTVKQRLAALRMPFDWMVVGQVIPSNPAHAVRGPKHSQKHGRTPVLKAEEARELMNSIGTASLPGLRNRALIATMVYTFARVGAVIAMRVEDYFVQGRRGLVRLHEKGGKEHEMPPITVSTATSRNTSPRRPSPRTRKGRCSGPAATAEASWRTGPCCSQTSGA